MSKTYAEKLKDPRWQRKRLEILERDKFTCRFCRSTEKTLHVHHRIYLKGRQPWDYEDHVFATLCEDCHEESELRKNSVLLTLGRNHRQDQNIDMLAQAIDGNPIELTFWGWAAEHLAQCVRMHNQMSESTDDHERSIIIEEMKTAAVDAVRQIFDALASEEKKWNEL
jgi:hypothetical protein